MKIKPNFRSSADQMVDSIEYGPYLVTFLGKCPLTGVRLYDLPEGLYPEHQAIRLKAVDLGQTGSDFIASASAVAEPITRLIVEQMAKATWKGAPVKPLTNAHVIGVTARKNKWTRNETKGVFANAPWLIESIAAEILLSRLLKSRMNTKTS